MSTELADTVGAELACIYVEWVRAYAAAATLLNT
jgi:hypothetical protein